MTFTHSLSKQRQLITIKKVKKKKKDQLNKGEEQQKTTDKAKKL